MKILSILKEGASIGLRNSLSIIGAYLLYILTIWVPYINVGTTIAIVSLPVSISKGRVISPLEIFYSKYRKNMGTFFLLLFFMFFGYIFSILFLVIPFIILSLSWSQAIFLLVDKGINPMQALNESNKITYNYKIKIFLIQLVLSLAYFIIYFTINLFFVLQDDYFLWMLENGYSIGEIFISTIQDIWFLIASGGIQSTGLIGSILTLLLSIVYSVIEIGTKASIYKFLNEKN